MPAPTKTPVKVLLADSETDPDMLYAVGIFVPDPFLFLEIHGEKFMVVSDLEIDRAKAQATECTVLSLMEYHGKLHPGKNPKAIPIQFAPIIALILKEHRIRSIQVPHRFPFGVAQDLQKLGIRLSVLQGSFFPHREIKTAAEIRYMKESLRMTEVGFARAEEVLSQSSIGKGQKLQYNGSVLTSERLRTEINTVILQQGGNPRNTIVAGGEQACDPHERGSGPLKANQPIILDIFPRSEKTGYYGDLTRTMVKGKASEAVHKIYLSVQTAQRKAIQAMHPNVPNRDIHQIVVDHFNQSGFTTQVRNGHMEGFFHGTGHGLGLELHEMPRLSLNTKERLQVGNIITVEPGLYYPGVGGVRLEDVVLVTDKGPKTLSQYPHRLEIN